MILQPLSEEELNNIYNWVDQIPLSRPKKNIARDFSDGVLMAEILYFYMPKIVDIHNYSGANSLKQKRYNWDTMNAKVFKRLGFQLSRQQVDSVIQCQPEAIERVLAFVQAKLENSEEVHQGQNFSPNQESSQMTRPLTQQAIKEASNENDWQKDQIIEELRETIEVLELKLNQMDEQMRQKDLKIQKYQQLLKQSGLM